MNNQPSANFSPLPNPLHSGSKICSHLYIRLYTNYKGAGCESKRGLDMSKFCAWICPSFVPEYVQVLWSTAMWCQRHPGPASTTYVNILFNKPPIFHQKHPVARVTLVVIAGSKFLRGGFLELRKISSLPQLADRTWTVNPLPLSFNTTPSSRVQDLTPTKITTSHSSTW